MKIGIKAGHTLTSGAAGIVVESQVVRDVAAQVASKLVEMGHAVELVIINDVPNASKALLVGIEKLNAANCDIVVELHLNACVNDLDGDGKTTGVEMWIYNTNSKAADEAANLCKTISALGLHNRGVKTKTSYTFLAKTNAPAIIAELFFCDDKDDVEKYSLATMSTAIAEGITKQKYMPKAIAIVEPVVDAGIVDRPRELYRVQVGAYSVKGNADAMKAKLKAAGFDATVIN